MISLEWILGIFLSVIGILVGWIFISALKDIKDSIRLINDKLESVDEKTDQNERQSTIHDYKIQVLEKNVFDSKSLADEIVAKIKAITP